MSLLKIKKEYMIILIMIQIHGKPFNNIKIMLVKLEDLKNMKEKIIILNDFIKKNILYKFYNFE